MNTTKVPPSEAIIDQAQASACSDLLWSTSQASAENSRVYAVLDGAKHTKILPLIHNSGLEYACLFSGKLSYALQRATPHLVQLERGHPFTVELIQRSWGQDWGIFLITDPQCDLTAVRKHCRRIAKVSAASGKSLYFRYYDPAILWPLLPVCSAEELKHLFGPARYILAPNSQAEAPSFKAVFREPDTLQLATQTVEPLQALAPAADYVAFAYTKAFKLRQAHLDVFEKKADLEFFKRIYKSYRKIYLDNPKKTFRVNGQELALPAFLWRCYPQGVTYKLENAYHFSVFFHLCSQYGWEFWQQDHCQWAADILSLPRPAEIRIEKIERKLSARLMESVWS